MRGGVIEGVLPVILGVAMTLSLAGYRFGESNHAVYLLAALRQNDPNLLTNDWWTRSTLQYHIVFNALSAAFMRAGIIEQTFLAGYVALAILLHVAWRRLTTCLGGTDGVYLASVAIFHLMAGGTGLGMYHFLQDSSFLPSNLANVAMLWAIYLWICGRGGWAAACFGLAGLFHLNHALAGIGIWMSLIIIAFVCRNLQRGWLIGAIPLIGLSAPAIVPALKSVLSQSNSVPLSEFVDLYVRLRHPHHYDPSTWPAGLWITFLLPIALAIPAWRIAIREHPSDEQRRAAQVFALFIAMLIVAVIGAGVWYVSEPLIQMSLYRFSIFPKLLSCIAAAWLIWRSSWGRIALRSLVACMLFGSMILILGEGRFEDLSNFLTRNVFAMWLFALVALVALLRPRVDGWGGPFLGAIVGVCVIVSLALSWPKLGLVHEGSRGDDTAYLALCNWVNQQTPRDAIFLVPPDEQSFRLHARRAIVVNFKNVPQLSGELGEWRDRLQNVLAISDLRALPRPFHRTLDAVRAKYATLPPEHLTAAAQRYGARYVVTVRPIDAAGFGQTAFSDQRGQYFLYDLNAP